MGYFYVLDWVCAAAGGLGVTRFKRPTNKAKNFGCLLKMIHTNEADGLELGKEISTGGAWSIFDVNGN